MKLSTKGRYAVMAMVDLALYANERPVSLAEIADRQEISLSYLEQLFAKLRREKLVMSIRGPGGGYRMAKDAKDTDIAEIFKAVEEPIRATTCNPMSPDGCRSDKSRCVTHDLWQGLSNHIYRYLHGVSIADVIERRIDPGADMFMTFDPNDGVAAQ
ncbi:Rrf2 family transcriptional regulator [uncultured Kiloniella sp.]|uniref:Rrf2 family transcriptional regulator n=1 Tax=Kiloniella sp. TaxID=1938587 RepID=UPI002608CC35|nr:Rrf2 family transcriptional regulator [uncultured Kiloniella sp.]